MSELAGEVLAATVVIEKNIEQSEVNVASLCERSAGDMDFYNKGLRDYVGDRKDTPAALGFIAYWSKTITQA